MWSPSVNVDQTRSVVKQYQKDALRVDDRKEKLYFDTYEAAALEHVIETQRQATLKFKERKQTKLSSILIIVDDFADEANFTRHSKLLHSLFTRGRHSAASTSVASQKINAISQII